MDNKFNTIDEILEDIKNGKIVVMIDDEDRENEGDVICAAEFATNETLWQVTQKGLSVCQCLRNIPKSFCCHRCVK